jgi:hypothetical protein
MVQDRVTYYDKCNRFYLSANDYTEYEPSTVVDVSAMTRVDEPVGWDNVNVVLNRDIDNHGATSSFTDGQQELNFECKAGRTLLRTQYLTYGTDAQVKFLFGDYNEDTSEFTVEFSADCNFNDFSYDDLYSSVNVELRDFASIVRSKFDQKVELDVDVEGAVTVGLASKVLPEKVILKNTGFGLFRRTDENPPNNVGYFMPQFGEGATTKYGELLIPNYDGTFIGENPKNIKRYLFQVEKSGQYEISVNTCLEFDLSTQIFLVGGSSSNVRLKTAVWRESTATFLGTGANIAPTSTDFCTSVFTFCTAIRFFFENITHEDLKLPKNLLAGDEVYLYFEITDNKRIRTNAGELVRIPTISNKTFSYEILCRSVFPASFVKALPIKIAAQQVLDELLSDIPAYSGATIESDFLDNCDTLLLTNGATLRAADVTNSLDITPKVSMNEIVETLKTVYAFGINLEPDNLTKRVRLEPYTHFYQNTEIVNLPEPYDYIETVNTETTYNEIEVGYDVFNKQRDDSSDFKDSSLNDIHATSIFATPIKTHKGKYTKKSPIIFSGYEIEAQRRIQFQEKEIENTKSYKNDDAIFAISYINKNSSRSISVTGLSTTKVAVIGVLKPFIKVGDLIRLRTLDGAPASPEATVLSIDYEGLNTNIVTDISLGVPVQTTNVEAGFLLVTISNNTAPRPVQEGNENLQVGGISPADINLDDFLESEYNLRFTPKRILFAHAGIINNCLLEKSGSELIKFVEGEGNDLLTTILNGVFTCNNGDVSYTNMLEGGDVVLSTFNNGEAVYRNRLIRFSHVMDWDTFNDIRFSMLGKSLSTDYGYISYNDLDGVERKGFLLNLEFNISENSGAFELLEIGVATEPPLTLTKLDVSIREVTSDGACSQTVVNGTLFTSDVTVIVGSVLSIDNLLIGTVVSGFYKWFLSNGSTKVIEVADSAIVSINDCPDSFQVNVGQTTFGSSALACNSNDNTLIRYSDDAVLIVGSFVYTDGGLVTPLATGYYKISGGRTIQIGTLGEVLAVTTCDAVFTHFISPNSIGFVEACNSASNVSAFSEDATIIATSILYEDGGLLNTLPEGYYRIVETGETVQVDASGEVIEVRECGDFEEATVYWGGSTTATPNATQVQALTFDRLFAAPTDGGSIALDFIDVAAGEFVVVSFPDSWFSLVDITDTTGSYSWFSDWDRKTDVTIGGENYRVYSSVIELSNISYTFKFLFEDI